MFVRRPVRGEVNQPRRVLLPDPPPGRQEPGQRQPLLLPLKIAAVLPDRRWAAMLGWAIVFLGVLADKTAQKRRALVALTVTSPLTCPPGGLAFHQAPPDVSPKAPPPVPLQLSIHSNAQLLCSYCVPTPRSMCLLHYFLVSRPRPSPGSSSSFTHVFHETMSWERGYDLPKVTQPASGGARVPSQAA